MSNGPGGARSLVMAALRDSQRAASAATELESGAPDSAVAACLEQAYATKAAPAWVIALLAGSNRHDAGYAVVREILFASPRESGAVYAGPAMAKIRGAEALPDLVEALASHGDLRTREGAALGLAQIHDRASIDAVVLAFRDGRIGRDCAASVLADLPLDEEVLCEWLEKDTNAALALVILGHRSARGTVSKEVARAALARLEGPGCPIAGSSWMTFLPARLRSTLDGAR